MTKTTIVILSGVIWSRRIPGSCLKVSLQDFFHSARNDRVDSRVSLMRHATHRTIVSPRAGPTLTIDSFAPVSSEMYLMYFLAAKGSCENFRAA